ncbi:MAG: Ig-like domain-containing protein [Bacillota bacterium]
MATGAIAAPPPPGYTRVEETDAAVQYSGTWQSAADSSYSGGTATYSTQVGATAQLSFSGTAVQWIGERGPHTGQAQVFLDGIHVADVNTASKQTTSQAVLYVASGLTQASHTLTIQVKKIQSAPPGQLQGVWVDAFDVLPISTDTTPPTATLTAPTDGRTISGTVTVSANASDNVGVTSVQFELDNAPLGAPDTTAPYSISWSTTAVSNGSHTLVAVARDAAGNIGTSQPVTVTVNNSVTRIEQDNPAVAYTGVWVTASDPTVSGGTAAESNQANATVTLTFKGTGVTWIGYKCTCASGYADVSVDGGPATQVDGYSATTEPQAPMFTASNLLEGTHTLVITVTGQYDRQGDTAYVVVDAFDVTP